MPERSQRRPEYALSVNVDRHALEMALKGDYFVYYWLHTRGGVRGEETRQTVRACRLSHTQR